jgi:hypothetical protein
MKTKSELKKITSNGFVWVYNEGGAHFFQKCLNERSQNSFALIRALPEDLDNGNFEYFAQHGLTNTNPA